MKAEEIRKLPMMSGDDLPQTSEGAGTAQVAVAMQTNLLLRELAAQIAEMNEHLSSVANAFGIIADYGVPVGRR